MVSVSRQRVPLGLALLLDTSASMENNLSLAKAAASEFVERMAPSDRASVIDFDSRVQVVQELTSEIPALRDAIARTTAGGSTSLFNALYIALKDLEKARASTPEEIRRQAIVVLSDGDDTSSLIAFEDVLDLAKRSHTSIYAIGIRDKNPIAVQRPAAGDFVLRRLAQETGGLAYFPIGADDLHRIYREIADELTTRSWWLMRLPTSHATDDGGVSRCESIVRIAPPVPRRATMRRPAETRRPRNLPRLSGFWEIYCSSPQSGGLTAFSACQSQPQKRDDVPLSMAASVSASGHS